MGSQLPEGYVGRHEAARMLGTVVDVVSRAVRKGELLPHYFKGRPGHFFKKDDIQAYQLARERPRTDHPRHATTLALQALAAARRNEDRLEKLYDHLGVDVIPLQRTEDAVLELYRSASAPITVADAHDKAWIRSWGDAFFGMDETYLQLVEHLTGDRTPWEVFLRRGQLLDEWLKKEGDVPLVPAHRFLVSGLSHLRHVSYLEVRRRGSAIAAGVTFDGRRTAVDELYALLYQT